MLFSASINTNILTENIQKHQPLEDTIRKSVFLDLEEKTVNYSFDLKEDKITIKSSTFHKKSSLIYFTDTIEKQITTFSANDIIYNIEVFKNKKKWFTAKFEKKANFSKLYEHEYEYLTKSDISEFKVFCEKNNLFIFNISAGNGKNYLVIDTNGNIKTIGEGEFKEKNDNFIASKFEIYNIEKDTTLKFTQFYAEKFKNEIDGLESYFDLVSDSTIMLTYFYNIYYELDINGNLLILNSNFETIKRTTIRKCPDDSFDYEVFGSFFAIFNPKFERVKLYSGKENKFYSLIPECKYVHTESGNVLEENIEQNEIRKKEILKKRKEFKNTVNFSSHCPSTSSFIYQIDTLNKKIVSCQIDEFRH